MENSIFVIMPPHDIYYTDVRRSGKNAAGQGLAAE
jgi:hypothetical protein